jgi:transcriptional regulator with XRE-family HTH domain
MAKSAKGKKRPEKRPLSDQLRQAIKASGLTRYSIWQQTGIDQGTLSKFMAGGRGLSLASIDMLGGLLRLRLVAEELD